MRSFALIAAALASLSAVIALPVSSRDLADVTHELGLSVVTETVGELTEDVPVLGRRDVAKDFPDFFDLLDVNIESDLVRLEAFDNTVDASDVIDVLADLHTILAAALPEVAVLKGEVEEVLFTTVDGVQLTVEEVVAKIAHPINCIIADIAYILTLDIATTVKGELTTVVAAAIALLVEVAEIDAAIIPTLDAVLVDTNHVVSTLGIHLTNGIVA